MVLALGWSIAILIGCSIPGTDIPQVDFNLFEEDKIIHFSLFFVFGWLWMAALSQPLPKRILLVCLSGLFYAGMTEVYQGWLPWDRTPDPMDALANAMGLFAGIGLFWWPKRSSTGSQP